MEDTQVAPPAPPGRAVELDPFEFYPSRRSVLGGLGGSDDRADPTYAFHTRYETAAPGRITFSVRLEELRVATGTLVLRVLAQAGDGHAIEPVVAATAQIPLRTIAERGGAVSVGVLAEDGFGYALLGAVMDGTDAILSALTVTLDRLDHGDTDAGGMTEGRTTRVGADAMRPVPLLISSTPPSLQMPMSQVRTEGQRDDPHYARWSAALGRGADDDPWAQVYPLRALESFGVLRRGARGLLLGAADPGMAAAIAAAGCTLSTHEPEVPSDDPPVVPDGLRGFDFLWTRGFCDRLREPGDGMAFVEQALACLAVGGVAVHVFRFVADTAPPAGSQPGALTYTRTQIERLALHLVCGNHEVAQFSYALSTGVRPQPTMFGMAVRKGSF